jgi:hypothetical protein
MASIPYDSVQSCQIDESLVFGDSVPFPIKNGENYIGIYNFNPGYEGTIKTLSLATKINWANPNAIPLSGAVYLKARQYNQSEWQILDSYDFGGTEDVSGEILFSLILISGETDLLSGLSQTPLILSVSGLFFDVGEELLGPELITNYNFASGEDDWDFTPTTDRCGNLFTRTNAVPGRMILTGCQASSVNYLCTDFIPSYAESDKFTINPNKRYKFTTYSPQTYHSSATIQDMYTRLSMYSLQTPKVRLSLSGEYVESTKAIDKLLYEWGFDSKLSGPTYNSSGFSTSYLRRIIPANVTIDSEDRGTYGTDYGLSTYLNPQATQSGESALIIEATGAVSLIYSPGMPHNLTWANLEDWFNYISLKEVTQEGTGTSGITLEPSSLIVRCMGETIE